MISRLCGLVLPYSSKILIDDVIAAKTVSLHFLLLVIAVSVFINAACSYALTLLLSIEAHRLIVELRMRIQRHVIHLPLSYFDNSKTGILVSRIMNDVEGVRNLVGTGLVQLIGGILQATVSLCILISITPSLTLVMSLPLICFAAIAMKAFSYLRPIFRERSKIVADVTGRLTESLGGIRVIKGFHAEAREQQVFEKGVLRIFDNIRKSLRASSLVSSSTIALMGVASVLIMGFGGQSILADQMSVGDFFAFTLIMGFLAAPIFQMANIGTQITEAFAGLDRMEEILAVSREYDNPNRSTTLTGIEKEIVFENVSFAYEDKNDVLRDINFTAPAGSLTALVGSSGSGKTTISGLAASFLSPRVGRVLVDGVDLETVSLDSYRSKLGVVLQDDFLFEGSIKENIFFANADASETELQNAIDAANVTEFTNRFSDGINTIIGERGGKAFGRPATTRSDSKSSHCKSSGIDTR